MMKLLSVWQQATRCTTQETGQVSTVAGAFIGAVLRWCEMQKREEDVREEG